MASYGPPPRTITKAASTDLSSNQYAFVKLDSSGQVAVCGANEKAFGILKNAPAAQGRPAVVWLLDGGVCKLKVDGGASAITESGPTYLESGASGVGHATTTDNDWIGAQALEDSSADGDIIQVKTMDAFYGA